MSTKIVLIRTAIVLAVAAPAAAQEQIVTPTYVQEHACYQSIPCETREAPAPCAVPASPCALPRVIHYEMRSTALFWTGAAFVAGGGTLVIASFTWARESVELGFPAAPCGTDPLLTRLVVAPCKVSGPLLAAGASLIGSGAGLMIYGGHKVAIGSDGRQITVRVRF
jgi:hypothetical protein